VVGRRQEHACEMRNADVRIQIMVLWDIRNLGTGFRHFVGTWFLTLSNGLFCLED
jgi:hypothetical protein